MSLTPPRQSMQHPGPQLPSPARSSTSTKTLSIAQTVPEELLEEIVGYVAEFEDDEAAMKTLHSMTLTCRSFFYPALPALYLDPSRAHSHLTRQKGTHLLRLLSNRPTLVHHVKKLTSFDKCYDRIRSEVRSGASSREGEEEAGRWAIEMLACCSNITDLGTRIRMGGEMWIALAAVNQLRNLRDLTIRGNSRRNYETVQDAQAFVSRLQPAQGKLASLRVTGFGFGGDLLGVLALERIPEPVGEHPSFQIEHLYLDTCDQDLAWSLLFLPEDPVSLRLVSFDSFTEFDVEVEALRELARKSSTSLEKFLFRGRGTERAAIVGSVMHYRKDRHTGTVFFPFTFFQGQQGYKFSVLTDLVLDGVHSLSLHAFYTIVYSCRQLQRVTLVDSVWDPDEWEEPLNAFDDIFESLQFVRDLHYLHLGHLPLLSDNEAATWMVEGCSSIGIDCEWQPCLDGMSEWEERQRQAWIEIRETTAAFERAVLGSRRVEQSNAPSTLAQEEKEETTVDQAGMLESTEDT